MYENFQDICRRLHVKGLRCREALRSDAGMSTLEGLILMTVVLLGVLTFRSAYNGKLGELVSDFTSSI